MYIIKCKPTMRTKRHKASVMYYEDTWNSGTVLYISLSNKELAKKFNTRQEAEDIARGLLSSDKIKNYIIEEI